MNTYRHIYPSQIISSPSVTTQIVNFFDHLLRQCTLPEHCKQVHTQIVTTGGCQSAFLAARLINVYARLGLVFDAQKVFDSTQFQGTSNMLLWNAVLRANVSHGFYEKALKIYDKMRRLGVWADGFTLPLVIRACAFMGRFRLCKNVHSHVLQMGFQNHLHVVNELMGMYGKLGNMDYACQLFDKMSVRSYVSWNTLVSSYAFNYDCDGASEIFNRMELDGLEPNPVTWTSLLSSHARCGRGEKTMELFGMMRVRGIETTAEALAVVLSVCADVAVVDKGKKIHGYVVRGGFEEYLFVKNALICMYGKCGDVENAYKLFLVMQSKNLVSWNALISSYAESGLCDEAFAIFSQLDAHPVMTPNIISWSAVIQGFSSTGQGEKSLELFRQMQRAGVLPNCVTISSVLSVCAELAAINLGREIHGHVVRALMDSNILVGNGLINMYTKCGSFEEGHRVFENIDSKDLISWNTMIAGYGMHGLGENALRIFHRMVKTGFKPDNVTFIAVLSACSHGGLVTEGRLLFDQMIGVYGVKPQMEHYACMVDLLGRAGLLQEGSNIVKNMPMKPNACVWSALLNSCRMHKNTDIAEETATHIFNMNSEMAGSYMLMSNIYAASGRWEDSAKVRISAKAKGLRKIRGQSWIQVKNKVFIFSAGNTMQAGVELIHGILYGLVLQMESEGYVPNKEVIQENIDKELD
ncbi:putative pentatricopeptide repeat-containing protein At1g17630 [Rosa rugosa]|uniref:putative pentatricopeptide repeat-containing protein At1g17630 n=1 Tax=Rosa rugosa TaxID=74645 RepID=UPI002B4005E1|nr:putative pentatricopeptide repeat-containing protein At1g17630 [Rosa rugosa]XP_062008652.1 putative pentatricopeptide repeat-containing protein At1g17630 [Rosa rugosa]XP_062008653.1 putative pentatricopeptide repeat-containing protein At1g17630 [Rosa rugosa]XP_062008654.1 putative pentatricopeptide repeat-containing protein At1g17630 [Rosa rugosa]XP_062008655.1 putative pentatricopeptide repeat-containing protein At1g17630 [Rosa rugosa]XP_062008656.1 putative pentatricopeptide repeat-contai